MPDYGDKNYWDRRYEAEEGKTYDWILDFSELKPFLEKYLKPSDKIINMGCGNNAFSEELYKAGYTDQWNVDYSKIIIDQMSQKYADKPSMRFE